MSDGAILATNIAGGFSVLIGYTFVSLTGVGSKMYKIFHKNEKTVFLTLSFFSIISFFYLLYWAGTTGSLKEWRRDLYLASLAVYLFGASIWSPIIYNIVSKKKHPSGQIPALFVTGAGTVGMLVAIACETDNLDLEYSFAMTAAIFLVIQHAFFDLFYWSSIHSKKAESRKRI